MRLASGKKVKESSETRSEDSIKKIWTGFPKRDQLEKAKCSHNCGRKIAYWSRHAERCLAHGRLLDSKAERIQIGASCSAMIHQVKAQMQ